MNRYIILYLRTYLSFVNHVSNITSFLDNWLIYFVHLVIEVIIDPLNYEIFNINIIWPNSLTIYYLFNNNLYFLFFYYLFITFKWLTIPIFADLNAINSLRLIFLYLTILFRATFLILLRSLHQSRYTSWFISFLCGLNSLFIKWRSIR